MKRHSGFTLIELMIVVAVVAILAGVALPAYQQYVVRGRVAGATQLLLQQKTVMEGFFGPNRRYDRDPITNAPSPCASVMYTEDKFFKLTCTTGNSGQTFIWNAKSTDGLYEYTINEAGQRQTIGHAGSYSTSTQPCWITKRGQTC